MIRFIRADDLHLHSQLRDSMFRDRADQFKTRLGWAVSVDGTSYEMDAYDRLNPLYVICQGADGGHLGSMRFLPMTGPNMIEDHFSHLVNGRQIGNDRIWECTRFCLGQNAGPHVAGRLMSAGGEILHGFGLDAFAGVFDERMIRIYKNVSGLRPRSSEVRDRGVTRSAWVCGGSRQPRAAAWPVGLACRNRSSATGSKAVSDARP